MAQKCSIDQITLNDLDSTGAHGSKHPVLIRGWKAPNWSKDQFVDKVGHFSVYLKDQFVQALTNKKNESSEQCILPISEVVYMMKVSASKRLLFPNNRENPELFNVLDKVAVLTV